MPFGDADVVVADGFAGNVLLKTMEGTADVLMKSIKKAFTANVFTMIGALFVKGQVGTIKKSFSTEEVGGAPLLGVKKPVIKAHGNAKAYAIKNAIRVAAEFAAADVVGQIEEAVAATADEGQDDDE